ncbi:MAG: hypothetical protein GX959_02055 [Clostridiales bacterium]|jgi:hypothetical protein|nr:hypothetical protein [Clostridiales bacterium]
MMVRFVKTYVDVIVRMRTDGTLIPISVIWEGQTYDVDGVLQIIEARSQKVPSTVGTIKYVCRIQGQDKEMFLEDYPRRWFVEKPVIQFF